MFEEIFKPITELMNHGSLYEWPSWGFNYQKTLNSNIFKSFNRKRYYDTLPVLSTLSFDKPPLNSNILPVLKKNDTNTFVKEISINDLNIGDIIVAVRWGGTYLHYGVYVGNRNIVHFSYHHDEKIRDTRIIKTSYAEFSNDSPTFREPLREGMTPNSGKETARIAEDMKGNKFGGYNLLNNNCEHFANYCKYNKKISYQIEDLFKSTGGTSTAQKLSYMNKMSNNKIIEIITRNIFIPQKYEKIKNE